MSKGENCAEKSVDFSRIFCNLKEMGYNNRHPFLTAVGCRSSSGPVAAHGTQVYGSKRQRPEPFVCLERGSALRSPWFGETTDRGAAFYKGWIGVDRRRYLH